MNMGQYHPWILNNVKKIKQEWSLLEPMVDLFQKIEEGEEFYEATNNPLPGGKVVNIEYLLILRNGGTEKFCEKWKDMIVGQKKWKAFTDHFAQAYSCYQIRKKLTAAAHIYGASENYDRETDAQRMTENTIQELANVKIEDKESTENLTSINLTLSQILNQAQESILVLSKLLIQQIPIWENSARHPHYLNRTTQGKRSYATDHGQTEHRQTHNLKPQEILTINLSHVKVHNGFTAS